MNCIESKGRRFSGTCITCASSSDPSKCIKCLDTFYPKLTCATADYNNCYKPDFDNPCATCQKVGPLCFHNSRSSSSSSSKPDLENSCAVCR
jgi:hypothetical protein